MIDISEDERMRAFSVWLRTGRLPTVQGADGIELKFNPWHDPETGRFTFRGAGRSYGRRWGGGGFTGGGGSTNWRGGGASSHEVWPAIPKSAKVQPRPSTLPHTSIIVVKPVQTGKPAISSSFPAAKVAREPLLRVVRNGYEYRIDARGRTRGVSGSLTLATTGTAKRSRTAQAGAGGSDRRTRDDGGHYIAARFNGPTEAFNHFAQDANFNRGGYRALEDSWAKAKKAGHRVVVHIKPMFEGKSRRPTLIQIVFFIDNQEHRQRFPNEHKGHIHGK